jgi:hypothetical protein
MRNIQHHEIQEGFLIFSGGLQEHHSGNTAFSYDYSLVKILIKNIYPFSSPNDHFNLAKLKKQPQFL